MVSTGRFLSTYSSLRRWREHVCPTSHGNYILGLTPSALFPGRNGTGIYRFFYTDHIHYSFVEMLADNSPAMMHSHM